jgi:hypothetical protein
VLTLFSFLSLSHSLSHTRFPVLFFSPPPSPVRSPCLSLKSPPSSSEGRRPPCCHQNLPYIHRPSALASFVQTLFCPFVIPVPFLKDDLHRPGARGSAVAVIEGGLLAPAPSARLPFSSSRRRRRRRRLSLNHHRRPPIPRYHLALLSPTRYDPRLLPSSFAQRSSIDVTLP